MPNLKRRVQCPSDEVSKPAKKARMITLPSLPTPEIKKANQANEVSTPTTSFLSLPSELCQSILFQTYDDFRWFLSPSKCWQYDLRSCIREFLEWARNIKKAHVQLIDDMDYVEKEWLEIYAGV
jgi:hypothetical protein